MKAVINEKETPVKPKYPYLGVSTNSNSDGLIVLFTGQTTGVVVNGSKSGFWNIGNHTECWAEDSFTPFTGTITLSND